jgi:hypothetical protein
LILKGQELHETIHSFARKDREVYASIHDLYESNDLKKQKLAMQDKLNAELTGKTFRKSICALAVFPDSEQKSKSPSLCPLDPCPA